MTQERCSKCDRCRPDYIADPTCPSGGYHHWRESKIVAERCGGCGLYPDEIDPKKECEAGGTHGHHMIDVDERGMAIGSVDVKCQDSEDGFFS
jgi:hypothetical protein